MVLQTLRPSSSNTVRESCPRFPIAALYSNMAAKVDECNCVPWDEVEIWDRRRVATHEWRTMLEGLLDRIERALDVPALCRDLDASRSPLGAARGPQRPRAQLTTGLSAYTNIATMVRQCFG